MLTKGTYVNVALVMAASTMMLGMSIDANAALFEPGETTWREEVLLHDGSKLVAERTMERGGRREIGQEPPIKQQSLSFDMPGTHDKIVWRDEFSEDVGGANFNLKLLDILNGTPYVVGMPAGCASYNKWGRPNPPYVVFKHDGNAWQRIPLDDLPAEIKTPNLIPSSPDHEARKAGSAVVSAGTIKKLYEGYRQPEYKSILREPLAMERVLDMCEERVLYRGYWMRPNDPVAKRIIDRRVESSGN